MIRDHLVPERVIVEGWAATKRDVLSELASLLATATPGVPKERVLASLREREESMSTAIGRGVAMPHGRLDEVQDVALAVILYPRGIAFDAADGEPIHVAFGIVGPPPGTGHHVKLLASIARFIRTPGAIEALRAAPTREAIVEVFRAHER